MNKKEVWFLGGGSGGHIFPLLTIYKTIKELKEYKYTFWTDHTSLVSEIMIKHKDEDLVWRALFYPKPSGIFGIFSFLYYTLYYFFVFFSFFLKNRPTDIYLTGGYIGISVTFLSSFFNLFSQKKVSVHIYHLDVVPGSAARLISFFNPYQYIVYDESLEYVYKRKYVQKVDYPLRYKQEDRRSKTEAREMLGIDQLKKVILVLGGSQGSCELNNLLESLCGFLSERNCFLVHQTGKKEKEKIKSLYEHYAISADVFDFKKDIHLYLEAADVVISRAGAGSIAEIVFFGKKAVLIPLKGIAGNHQVKNAYAASKKYKNIYIFSNLEKLRDTLNKILLML